MSDPEERSFTSHGSLDGGPFLDAVTNIGVRPTFNESDLTIESFVLNNTVPADAAAARLDFIYRLRDEKKFESPDALRAQIGLDVGRARRVLRTVKEK
jgi:riboflavin kinase/FMN adenylyltransferase